MKTQTNLKLVEQGEEEKRRQEETWKLTRDEVAGRVRETRKYLEEFADRLSGLQFDVLNRDCPASLDCVDPTHPYQLAERLCPSIAGRFDRVDEQLPDTECRDDLMELKMTLAEVAFAIGVFAGSLFSGLASQREIDRLERGLVWAITSRRSEIKDG